MGGWSNVITQSSKILPSDIPLVVDVLKTFENEFNEFIDRDHHQPIKFGNVVGSTAYFERDLIENPTKEYGDIDVIFVIPRMWQMTESANTTLYRQLIENFIHTTTPIYLLADDTVNGANIIFIINGKFIQIDFITTFPEYEKWATFRMTPEYGLKGIFMGFLFASLAEVLYLSIGTSGIQAKFAEGKLIPFKKRKFDTTEHVTSSIEYFAVDIVTFFSYLKNINPNVCTELLDNPNMHEISFKNLVSMIIGIGKSLELNGLFGVGNLYHIKNYDDYITQIVSVFNRKADESVNASKFNKASTEEAINKANATKKLITEKSKELVKLLA